MIFFLTIFVDSFQGKQENFRGSQGGFGGDWVQNIFQIMHYGYGQKRSIIEKRGNYVQESTI